MLYSAQVTGHRSKRTGHKLNIIVHRSQINIYGSYITESWSFDQNNMQQWIFVLFIIATHNLQANDLFIYLLSFRHSNSQLKLQECFINPEIARYSNNTILVVINYDFETF